MPAVCQLLRALVGMHALGWAAGQHRTLGRARPRAPEGGQERVALGRALGEAVDDGPRNADQVGHAVVRLVELDAETLGQLRPQARLVDETGRTGPGVQGGAVDGGRAPVHPPGDVGHHQMGVQQRVAHARGAVVEGGDGQHDGLHPPAGAAYPRRMALQHGDGVIHGRVVGGQHLTGQIAGQTAGGQHLRRHQRPEGVEDGDGLRRTDGHVVSGHHPGRDPPGHEAVELVGCHPPPVLIVAAPDEILDQTAVFAGRRIRCRLGDDAGEVGAADPGQAGGLGQGVGVVRRRSRKVAKRAGLGTALLVGIERVSGNTPGAGPALLAGQLARAQQRAHFVSRQPQASGGGTDFEIAPTRPGTGAGR